MIRSALANPYLVIVTALATLVLGSYSYTRIPADLLPMFETSAVQIVTFYPGMPPEVMEKDIMSRLQRWTGQSVGIEHQEAKAMQGVCIVKDFFREGVSMDTAMSQVTSYAMSDMFYLPPGTIPPMVMPFDPTASVPLCLVVVSNPAMNESELYDIAYYELRNKLQSIQGVIAPAVYGGKLRRILAYVDREKLESLGMSLMDVQRALMEQNVLIPAGSIKVGKQELQIFTNANVDKVEQLNDIPIKVVNGETVLMRQVGEVRSASQIQTNIVRINKARMAYIPIYRQPGSNTIEIVRQITRQLETIEGKLKVERREDPKMSTLVLNVAMDQSIGVETGLNSLQTAALLGAALAGLVVLVFLRSLRNTMIVVIAIPLAILAAIFGMFFTGDTINAMTLGGLALAIGILVDQSIVVLENVVRHSQMGKTPRQAALEGTQEVAMPMLVATITFAIVFFPVVFLSGLAKFLFTPLAVAASIAIFASYLLAITLVPAYCAAFLRVPVATATATTRGWFTRTYGRTLQTVVRLRWLVVLLAATGFAGALSVMANQMGRELFPAVDASQVSILVRMPTGTRIEQTEARIQQIEAEIVDTIGQPDPTQTNPASDLQLLISNIGVLLDWPAAYTPNNGAMDAFVLVQTKGAKSIFEYVEELRDTLTEKFPEVEFAFDTGGMLTAALNMGEPSPIHFQIQSSQLKPAQNLASIIKREAQQVPGTADARIAQRIDYPILDVEMNRELASRLGLNPNEVMKNLVAATNSSINFQPAFWIDEVKGNHYFLGVQYREERLDSLEALRTIPVGWKDNRPIRLGTIAEIRRKTGPSVIYHRNISRVTDVYVNVRPGYDVGGVVSAIEQRLEELGAQESADERGTLYRADTMDSADSNRASSGQFEGITFRMMGEVRTMRESFSQFISGLAIAAILVYLVLVAQFRSFVDPFIVLLTVPLGFIGVVVALTATQTHLSIMAFMGIIMMVGIVVEYSIVLIDFANHLVAEGQMPREAIVEAAQVRLRPILMTSLTTWLALLPMAIGSAGGEANVPLARAIIGGVLGATVLSLLVVPCLYVMLKRRPRAIDTPAALSSS
ncbi:MAG: efflux RND transporter permease subunit [Planctomycetota bacterium]|nr:efflux RND transporter permease subunit [Planctomycetota bacterium]